MRFGKHSIEHRRVKMKYPQFFALKFKVIDKFCSNLDRLIGKFVTILKCACVKIKYYDRPLFISSHQMTIRIGKILT